MLPAFMQDDEIRPAMLRKQPFVVARSIQGVEAAHITITLHMSGTIDEAYRTHSIKQTVSLTLTADSTSKDNTCQQVHALTTQVATYPSGSQTTGAAMPVPVESSCEAAPPAKRLRSDA